MESNTKYLMAVFSLMLGISWGIPYLVSEERNTDWLMLAIFFLLLALIFWLWIMREQRSAEDAAEDALDAAEENLKKLEAQAAEPAPAPKSASVETKPKPKAEPVEVEAKAGGVMEVVATEVEPAKDLEAIEEVAEDAKAGDPVAQAEVANASAAAQSGTSAEPVDLTRIEGIGPKYAEILIGAGITTYAQIAAMSEDEIVELIKANGGRKSASMATWSQQAKLAAAGDWDGLAKLQEELSSGRR